MKQEIIQTADGSHTLFVKELNEQYHSVNGAITEALHVYIKNGIVFRNKKEMTVFEIGFGTGLNCLLTLLKAKEINLEVKYVSTEKYPLEKSRISSLNYFEIIGKEAGTYWRKIHESDWGNWVDIDGGFKLLKLNTDITNIEFTKNLPFFDVVYFDAFGPDVQPEMWEEDIFKTIYQNCNPDAVITTYSAKGEVRRRMQRAGFNIERLSGPPGKKEMLRGIKAD